MLSGNKHFVLGNVLCALNLLGDTMEVSFKEHSRVLSAPQGGQEGGREGARKSPGNSGHSHCPQQGAAP